MSKDVWLEVSVGCFVSALLILTGMLLPRIRRWMAQRKEARGQVVEEHVQLVGMPGMSEPRTQPLCFDEVLAATFLDEIALLPDAPEPPLPCRDELLHQIDLILDSLMEYEESSEDE